MSTKVDYAEAAQRHVRDASLLLEGQRRANAGQLFGFGAECAVKAILVAFGASKPDGSVSRDFFCHLPNLLVEVGARGVPLATHPAGRQVTAYWAMLGSNNNFDQWDIAHRYWREAELPLDTELEGWRASAEKALQMLTEARLDGVL